MLVLFDQRVNFRIESSKFVRAASSYNKEVFRRINPLAIEKPLKSPPAVHVKCPASPTNTPHGCGLVFSKSLLVLTKDAQSMSTSGPHPYTVSWSLNHRSLRSRLGYAILRHESECGT